MRARTAISATKEDITSYFHTDGSDVMVTICHGEDDGSGVFVATLAQTPETLHISNADYVDLMLADPTIGKPSGTFRKDDLWKYIDLIRL